MKQKSINILAIGLFIFIITSLIITLNRGNSLYQEIQNISSENISNIFFYKDPIRYSSGLEKSIDNQEIIKSFLHCIKKMNPSNISIKSYKIQSITKIQFKINTEGSKSIEATIYRFKELGNKAVISLNILDGVNWPAGKYSSLEFLPWIDNIRKIKGFENISERKRYR